MRRLRLFTLISGLALIVSACADDSEPTDSEGAWSAYAQLPTDREISQQVPGFGGYFLDADGIPTLYLTAGSDQAPAQGAFETYLAGLGLPATEVRVIDGQYGWQDLEDLQLAATASAFDVEGTVLVDNDETTNRVRIGVDSAASEARVRAAMAKLGVRADAILVEQVDPIYQVATLQAIVDRPVRAGVQINFPGFLCSVGFNATSGGVRSFITASHCTTTQGGVENTPYFQPLQSVNGTQIATEVSDPAYTRLSGCPRARVCRRSDSSRAAYVDGANQALGMIARTSGPNNGSLEVVGSFTIRSDDTNNGIVVGATVNKVGRTTGWTSGVVTNKCVNTGVSGTRIVQLCQNFVSAGVGGGDSGSDVFTRSGTTDAGLEGILWGGNGAGNQFVYSPLQNVIQELGPLTTH